MSGAQPGSRSVRLPDGRVLPAIGQGTWRMGEVAARAAAEVRALQLGLDLGMTVVDTAEMYGDGGAEEIVGRAVATRRDDAFIVSKVLPSNASRSGVAAACRRSLKRLRIERIDLYLLHWRGATPLAETVEAFERLCTEGLVGAWGVSNFDLSDMRELDGVAGPGACATNQVLYSLDYRGPEHDLLPFSAERGVPLMAYSPVGQGGHLLRAPALRAVAERHNATPAQAALAWCLRQPGVMAIPKASDEAHVRDNAAAAALALTADDLAMLDQAFPPPRGKVPLAML